MSGSYPEYGAIFMSNRCTMKECFEKRLFGLPCYLSDFVRGVKEGMILFLFEYEERKLYGVFEAISDGGTNIVPEAYTSSGKRFPAQVKFTTIWHCEPLSEYEFCDAIRDNYFATNKFKFGLSKDQIQSLLCLFSSRKLKVPNSSIFNKSVDGDNDLSPAVGWNYSLSSGDLDTSRKSKDIRCDDDAYDPEHPGFHCQKASGVHQDSAVGHEPSQVSNNFVGQELVTLHEDKEKFHISAEDVEEFIPLPSTDHSDIEEGEVACDEFFGEEHTEWGEFVDYTESLFSVPKLPLEPFLSSKELSHMKMEQPLTSSHGSSCYGNDESSVTSLPLLDASDDYQSKDRSNESKKMLPKSMYSDCPNRKASVFSRLNFASKDTEQADQKAKPQKPETGSRNMKKRTSVFLRLTSASEATAQEVVCMTRLQQESDGWKKRNIDDAYLSERDTCHDKAYKPLNHFLEMVASECDTQVDGFKDDISIPEIMENLLLRQANWRKCGGGTKCFEQRNVYRRVNPKSGISHA